MTVTPWYHGEDSFDVGWQKRFELPGELLECDDSRVYNATFRRKLPPPAED